MVCLLLTRKGCFSILLRYIERTPTPREKKDVSLLEWGGAGKILVVVYTLRGDEIRLISARHATRQEVKDYEG